MVAVAANAYSIRKSWSENLDGITCNDPNYNFATVSRGDAIEHEFVVRNSSAVAIDIIDVKKSCSCTMVDMATKNIRPRETAVVHVKARLMGPLGSKKETIVLKASQGADLVLTLTGSTESAYEFEPTSVVFDLRSRSEEYRKRVLFRFHGQGSSTRTVPRSITKVGASDASVQATLIETREGAEVVVALDADGYAASLGDRGISSRTICEEKVYIYTNDPANNLISVPISIYIGDPLNPEAGGVGSK